MTLIVPKIPRLCDYIYLPMSYLYLPMNEAFILKVPKGSSDCSITTLISAYQIVLRNNVHNYRHSKEAYVWFSDFTYLLHGRMLAFHSNQICGLRSGPRYLSWWKKGTRQTQWKKLDLLECYCYPRWEHRCMFDLNLYMLRTSALSFPYLQAKSSSWCHPHVHLVKEEEKCMTDQLLFKSQKATGESIQFPNCVFYTYCLSFTLNNIEWIEIAAFRWKKRWSPKTNKIFELSFF